MFKNKLWLVFALITTLFWGLWGALTELIENAGFPGTYIYIVWSVSMIVPAFVGLKITGWKLDTDARSILLGCIIGLLGAGGQLALFTGAIVNGPAYLIFSLISLSPVITIIFSALILREKASRTGWVGIILAMISIPLLSYQSPDSVSNGLAWLIFALIVLFAWGIQAFFMKLANNTMKAESIFFYMMLTGLLLSPIAWFMTDKSQLMHWEFKSISMAFGIQLMNSIGALTLVYAFRYGKAIVVSPLTNAVGPIITILLSLVFYSVFPHIVVITGILLAIIAISILAKE